MAIDRLDDTQQLKNKDGQLVGHTVSIDSTRSPSAAPPAMTTPITTIRTFTTLCEPPCVDQMSDCLPFERL